MNGEQLLKNSKIIFKARVGSHLYGLNRPDSDEDFVTVFIPPEEYILGLRNIDEIDQSSKKSNVGRRNTSDDTDDKAFTLTKFVRLLLQNNPNIVELLFVNEENLIEDSPEFYCLQANYEKFISVQAYDRFMGYAYSQKKKLEVKAERYHGLCEAIEWMEEGMPMSIASPTAKFLQSTAEELNKIIKYYKGSKHNTEPIHEGLPVKIVYEKLVEERDKYGWRVKTESFDRLGYDCHSEDTEFLTDSGWKYIENVDYNDKLATINPDTLSLEYQEFSEKVEYDYEGPIYIQNAMYFNCAVTPNHKMFVSQCHKQLSNNFSCSYGKNQSNWQLKSVEELDNSRKSWFHVMTSFDNNNLEYPVDDEYLILIGLYLSDGTFQRKQARLYQTDKGNSHYHELANSIEGLKIYSTKKRELVETTWVLDVERSEKLLNDCGKLKNKHFPSWIHYLSKRQATLLLDAIMSGDGTERKDCFVYYSTIKEIANGVQTIALLAGLNSNLRGPYENNTQHGIVSMYHVYCSKKQGIPIAMLFNSNAVKSKRQPSRGGRIVNYKGKVGCFTVPNSVLITRREGKIAVTGNSKFAYHLIRLMVEAEELITTGRLEFPLQDTEDIVRVRSGEVALEEIYAMYDERRAKVDKLFESSDLRSKPDFKWAHEFVWYTKSDWILLGGIYPFGL